MDPLILPKGFGFQALTPADLRAHATLLDLAHIWESPRRRGARRYIIGVDVADGIGEDRSVIEVVRMGTIEESAEQVCEYASARVSPAALAFVIHAIGTYYRDGDGIDALVAIENNGHGMSTQDTLQLHLGYTSFYRWEYLDAANSQGRYSTKIGWSTTTRSRPILLDKLHSALTTIDPVTHQPDLITHSSLLHEELKDFQTDGALWEAAGARGAHDDTVMALAIANYVAYRMQAGETEPLEERRRRRSEQQARNEAAAAPGPKPDWRNTPASAEDLAEWEGYSPDGDRDEEVDEALFDPLGAGMRR
jgi:hypothetical protein